MRAGTRPHGQCGSLGHSKAGADGTFRLARQSEISRGIVADTSRVALPMLSVSRFPRYDGLMRAASRPDCRQPLVRPATLDSLPCVASRPRLPQIQGRVKALSLALPFIGCALVEPSSKRSVPQEPVNPAVFLRETSPERSAEITAAQVHTASPLSALVGLPWMVPLSDDPKIQDLATLPLGATERRPVVVAVHGAGDRPDWACGGWRIGVESFAFVTCPMGSAMGGSRYGWGSTRAIAVAVDRALEALRRRFPNHVGDGPMIYAGFSQGATLARPFLIENAQRFPLVVLAEGGYGYVGDPGFSKEFRAAGGRRLMLLCGTSSCLATANRSKPVIERAGLEVIISGDPSAGHNLNTFMQNALRRDWGRLVADFAGWETYPAHRWPK